MGLDMYLTKKTYIGANYDHNNVTGTIDIKKDCKDIPIKFNRVTNITEQVGYWRKANQIHNWFVLHCQNGDDECQNTHISIGQLEDLLITCKKVIQDNDLAEELLPISQSFFFGGTEYDEYYYNDIEYTIELIESLLLEDNTNSDFYYQSSW
jgi:hypothetical protein